MKKEILPEKLNICMVATKFPIKGRAAHHGYLWPIARSIASRGHDVTVLAARSAYGQKSVVQDSIRVDYLLEGSKGSPDFSRRALDAFTRLHSKKPFHIVHSIDSSGYKIAKRKKSFQLPLAFDVEATQMSQLFSILGMAHETLGSLLRTGVAVAYKFLRTYYGGDRRLLRTADGVFVTSPQQRLILERYYLYPDAKVFTIPYGIEISIEPREKSQELLAKWKIPANAKVVVMFTDMSELSEIRNILRAYQKTVIKKPSSRLLIVGNGPLWKTVEWEILNLALGNKVILTGTVPNTEIPDYVALSDIFINLSSRTSGFEPNMLEAMAQAKVVIGSEVSPIATIIEDGVNGFLIRPADLQTLSILLLQIITGQQPVRDIGQQARDKVSNLFDTEKMVTQTLNSYKEIMKQSGRYR